MANFGYAPYEEAAVRGQARMSTLQRLGQLFSGAGQGVAAARNAANPLEAGLLGFSGSYGAANAARQAAQQYAMKQIEAERAAEERQQRMAFMEAQIERMKRPEKPEKPEKLEPWQRTPEEQAALIDFETRLARSLESAKPRKAEKPEGPKLGDLNVLSDNFRQDKDVQNFTVVRDNFKRIEDSSKLGTGQGDLATIFSFMRVLDPESVVRETEFKNAAEAVGRLQQMANIPSQWIKGNRLTPLGRAGFRTAAKNIYETQRRTYNTKVEIYKRQAKAYGVDPTLIIPDYGDTPAGGGAKDPLGVR